MIGRRSCVSTFVLAHLFALALFGRAAAQVHIDAYPQQPIRIIVPTQSGGMADILSRVFAQKLKERTNATVVVENRTGANGVLAADLVAKSAPDGYTIYIGFQGTQSVLPHLDPRLPYDPAKDFAPIILVATAPCVLVVHPAFPARTVNELVAMAKQKPGAYSYASAGFGTTHHLAAELFKVATETEIAGVTYRGAAPANQDVIAGHVPIVFDNIGNAMNNIRAGTVRPLAITATTRSSLIPDVPTMAEAGFPNVVVASWFALFAPARTPASHIAWLNARANDIFSLPEIRRHFDEQGVTLPLGTPTALAAHVDAETKRWGEVIQKAGIKLP
jgi:tripartite-type tricarboxylate transporter receptor subunit TctC